MRRLPVYFLVDVSESMVGEPIQQVENGMRQIVQELRTDPYALETAFISVIAFSFLQTEHLPIILQLPLQDGIINIVVRQIS